MPTVRFFVTNHTVVVDPSSLSYFRSYYKHTPRAWSAGGIVQRVRMKVSGGTQVSRRVEGPPPECSYLMQQKKRVVQRSWAATTKPCRSRALARDDVPRPPVMRRLLLRARAAGAPPGSRRNREQHECRRTTDDEERRPSGGNRPSAASLRFDNRNS